MLTTSRLALWKALGMYVAVQCSEALQNAVSYHDNIHCSRRLDKFSVYKAYSWGP